MKVYHQLGFRENWNFDVFDKYSVGDGFIFSPVNLAQIKLEKLDEKYKKIGFLDPQCYYPNSKPKGKLLTYDYFPQNIVSSEICTTKFFLENDNSNKVAEECLKIQLKNDFEYLVIPFNRVMSSTMFEVIDKNKQKYLNPFLNELSKLETKKELLLTLVVSEDQIRHEESRNEILNWVTGIRKISGIYLIFQSERKSKQIKIGDILLSELLFIEKLVANDLKVIIGYTNTEALLYSIAMPTAITIGSYENLRKFNEDRFIENEKNVRSPVARLYSSYLLNWIPSGTINSIREASLKEFDKLFDKNEERPYNLSNEFNWHFTKPELYKHYFISFYNQVKKMPPTRIERIKYLKELINNALDYYQNANIPFDSDSDGEHLLVWKKVIEKFENLIED